MYDKNMSEDRKKYLRKIFQMLAGKNFVLPASKYNYSINLSLYQK